MITTGDTKVDAQIDKLCNAGQEHIFRFWDDLNEDEKKVLIDQVMEIDVELMQSLIDTYVLNAEEQVGEELTLDPCEITDREEDPDREKALEIGEQCIKDGKVCAFLVAGGQGSRLGFDGPKGAYQVGPVSDRSLFQIHAEKIRAAATRYNTVIPWYIMTSVLNHEDTIAFFEKHLYFGLKKEDVMFFRQAMIPSVDQEGKFFLSSKNTIFRNPNGHGGSIQALYASGAVEDMNKRGIEVISYFQVDNCLVRVIDPVFIGFHVMKKAQMSSKVLEKREPEEKLGVIGYTDGKLGVIEYSDLPEDKMYEKNEDGSLKYSAGSIAIHILDRRFVEDENKGGFKLPYHRAFKKIPHLNEKGEEVKPGKENGYKFETFVFDALGDTESSVTLMTRREEEFSPVKNKTGSDSPETARKDMSDLYKRWLSEAGVEGDLPGTVEISPLLGDSPETLKHRLKGGLLYK